MFTGSDVFGASAVVARGSSFVEPGIAPAVDVELTWATFSEAADEAGFSRRLGGIHFRPGDLAGRSVGRQVGAQVWQKARAHMTGAIAGRLTE